ncbi:MAG TPA: hypothetical protein VG013_00700 [Gemmataceae bacterium]|nr:hypothetical protein [Gemmataceae bacterium]
MKQWHPVFAQLLRPAVENYYEVRTTLPVGDAPREADFVLLRRTSQATPPFRGLWRHLTAWSILEFKGPTVSPRHGDIELLVELGLGIDRRLRQERGQKRRRPAMPEEVSFWYLANRLGHRFVRETERKLSGVDELGAGLWRCRLLGRLVFLVSSIHLPVEEDSLPLHIVGREPAAVEREVARLVLEEPGLQQLYGGWVASLHPGAWKEVEAMARTAGKTLNIDLRPAIEMLGLDRVIEQVGIDRVIEQVGIDRVIEHCGEKELIKRIGLDRWLANLSPAERRELKRRLQ